MAQVSYAQQAADYTAKAEEHQVEADDDAAKALGFNTTAAVVGGIGAACAAIPVFGWIVGLCCAAVAAGFAIAGAVKGKDAEKEMANIAVDKEAAAAAKKEGIGARQSYEKGVIATRSLAREQTRTRYEEKLAVANLKRVQRGDTTPIHIAANEPRIRIAPAVRAIGASMKRRPGVTHGSPVAR